MNLDDINLIKQIDQSGMIRKIRILPDQMMNGWNYFFEQNIEIKNKTERVVFKGFQNNKIIIETLQFLISPFYTRPFLVLADELIPDWCQTENLIILRVEQTNIEEMEEFIKNNLDSQNKIIALVSDNQLKIRFSKFPIPVYELVETSFSRNSIGLDVMFLASILYNAGLIPDLTEEILKSQNNIEDARQHLELEVKSSLNPAKRLAGQMVGRWVKIVSGATFSPVAKYWNQQINKSAKTISIFEDITDLVNHSINGILYPASIVQQSLVVFLKSDLNKGKINKILDVTKEELMCYGIGTDFYQTHGASLFSQVWNTIMFGDYLAFYLAIAYKCDPEPLLKIEI